MPEVIVCGAFDDIRSRDVRYLQEASRLGRLTVLLWSDECFRSLGGHPPQFSQDERLYILDAIRYVSRTVLVDEPVDPDRFPVRAGVRPDVWAVSETEDTPAKRRFCDDHEFGYQVIPEAQVAGFPLQTLPDPPPGRKKAIVTGCYDWLHSGHVRFFEVVSGRGSFYVSVGSDATIRALKGKEHPLLSQEERVYMVQAVRFVSRAFVGSGSGYLDAAPEIAALRPEIYAVNEDGDRPDKREFCRERGIEYLVLQRIPRQGLPERQSTHLRGY